MQIVLVFKVHDGEELARRGVVRRIKPGRMAKIPVSGRVVCELADHVVEFLADFLEAWAEHAERVVRDHAEQDGAHFRVGGFALLALLVRENGRRAAWDDIVHARVGEDAGGFERCVGDFVAEEKENGENGDDVAVGEDGVGDGL